MQVELQGKKYYVEQAALMEDSGFREIFQGLADDEERHYQFIKQIKESGLYDYQERIMSDDVADIFSGAVKNPNYVTIYQQALEFEDKAVELYNELARDATSEGEREAFMVLVREEEAHRAVLQRILDMLQRPEEYYPHL
jgi:rubrerythrin